MSPGHLGSNKSSSGQLAFTILKVPSLTTSISCRAMLRYSHGSRRFMRSENPWHLGHMIADYTARILTGLLISYRPHKIRQHPVRGRIQAGIFFGDGEAGEDVGFEIDVG